MEIYKFKMLCRLEKNSRNICQYTYELEKETNLLAECS